MNIYIPNGIVPIFPSLVHCPSNIYVHKKSGLNFLHHINYLKSVQHNNSLSSIEIEIEVNSNITIAVNLKES